MIQFNLEQWREYLTPEAQELYAKQGYYTQKLKTVYGIFDNVNIVAMNTEACYNMNFYLLSQRNDPGGVLAWLNETLHAIEARGEIAIVMAHHPPGSSDCLYQWSIRYKAITDRFQHIIRWSVFGHTHREEFGIARGLYSNKPLGVHFTGGSVSDWPENNPSFRVFEVDAQTMLPLRYQTYIFDLANHGMDQSNLRWEWSHEITQYYNMTDLSPSSFEELGQRIR